MPFWKVDVSSSAEPVEIMGRDSLRSSHPLRREIGRTASPDKGMTWEDLNQSHPEVREM